MQIQQEPLTDAQSDAILGTIGDIRKRQHSLKLILEGIFWINRTGAQWRNLDSKFPKWQLVYYYFRKFVKDGRWQKINEFLVTLYRQTHDKSDTPTLVSIDSQSVKITYLSKWNLIEHRLFCHVHAAMSGQMFPDYETVQRLIQNTGTDGINRQRPHSFERISDRH